MSLFTCLLAVTLSVTAQDQPKDPKLAEILNRMAKAYATCKTYRDTGTARSVTTRGDKKPFVSESRFTTVFVRPQKLRYEVRHVRWDKREECVILWRSGQDVKAWLDGYQPQERQPSITAAVSASQGIFTDAYPYVPAQLFIEEGLVGMNFTMMLKDAIRLEDAPLEDHLCYRMEVKHGPSLFTVWVDQKTFAVRQLTTVGTGRDRKYEHTVIFHPVLDGEVTEKDLEYNPPKK